MWSLEAQAKCAYNASIWQPVSTARLPLPHFPLRVPFVLIPLRALTQKQGHNQQYVSQRSAPQLIYSRVLRSTNTVPPSQDSRSRRTVRKRRWPHSAAALENAQSEVRFMELVDSDLTYLGISSIWIVMYQQCLYVIDILRFNISDPSDVCLLERHSNGQLDHVRVP